MYPSSTLCHAQEKLQRSRAADASLANVRAIAEKAAAAWRQEAHLAEKREQRHDRTRAIANLMAVPTRRSCEKADAMFSENPDRGFANG